MTRSARESADRRTDGCPKGTEASGPPQPAGRLAICIPTYRRPRLLSMLIADLFRQSRPVERLIVVDGDPDSGEVRRILGKARFSARGEIIYVPSNHANLSYQRYLGWRAAKGCDALLYLDDDLRISHPNAVDRVVAPLFRHGTDVVGVTAHIRFGNSSTKQNPEDGKSLNDRAENGDSAQPDPAKFTRSGRTPWIIRQFGSARSIEPGGLTPAGNRRMPSDRGEDYVRVEWLHGGVMAYRMDAVTRECFSDDLFALYHVRSGKGEDTFLSRKIRCRGTLLLALCATFEHPGEEAPAAYPTAAYRLGHAVAYSRRLINDHYRGFAPPTPGDRWSLVRTYVGTTLLSYARALRLPRKQRLVFASGYAAGAIRGLILPPSAKRLAPEIDWWRDAETALFQASRIVRFP